MDVAQCSPGRGPSLISSTGKPRSQKLCLRCDVPMCVVVVVVRVSRYLCMREWCPGCALDCSSVQLGSCAFCAGAGLGGPYRIRIASNRIAVRRELSRLQPERARRVWGCLSPASAAAPAVVLLFFSPSGPCPVAAAAGAAGHAVACAVHVSCGCGCAAARKVKRIIHIVYLRPALCDLALPV